MPKAHDAGNSRRGRRATIARRTMYIWPTSPDIGLVWCSEACCVGAIAYPPEDWSADRLAVVVPGPLVPFVKCYGCGLDAEEAHG